MAPTQGNIEIKQPIEPWVGVIIAGIAAFIAGTNFFYTRKKDKFNSLEHLTIWMTLSIERHAEFYTTVMK
jgi:uncharacterized membrane protein